MGIDAGTPALPKPGSAFGRATLSNKIVEPNETCYFISDTVYNGEEVRSIGATLFITFRQKHTRFIDVRKALRKKRTR
jgi:hypothetical protein